MTLGRRHEVTLPVEPTEVSLVDINGGKVTIHWKMGNLKLYIAQGPQYLLIRPKGRKVPRATIKEQPK